jgi:hypothetical protein
MPVLAAIHYDPRWRAAGKRPELALVALIAKLMAAVNSVAKHWRPFVMPPIFSIHCEDCR